MAIKRIKITDVNDNEIVYSTLSFSNSWTFEWVFTEKPIDRIQNEGCEYLTLTTMQTLQWSVLVRMYKRQIGALSERYGSGLEEVWVATPADGRAATLQYQYTLHTSYCIKLTRIINWTLDLIRVDLCFATVQDESPVKVSVMPYDILKISEVHLLHFFKENCTEMQQVERA